MSLSAPAPYDDEKLGTAPVLLSKTCQNCFMLKIRCDRTQRTDICDRCARLSKHCVFRPARRRDNSAKRDSRIHALEQQVQDLLHTQRATPLVQQPLPEGTSSATSSASGNPEPPPTGDVIDEDIVSIERADTLMELYKSEMMPHFPFIIIKPHDTAKNLRRASPFLFLAIISVACFHDLNAQEKLCYRFKYLVSEKILLGGDECLKLEYLQGLLIALAWNQYHESSQNYSQYLQLAISIAVDMRLDRKPVRPKLSNPGSQRNPVTTKTLSATWGPEEQRATAGLFYLSSTVSKLFDKMNTFPCTHFIEDGCLALQQTGEHRTDRDLYHVVRLQRIIEKIDTLARQSYSDADAQASFLRTRSELEEFRAYLVSDVSDSHLLFMQFHTAKLFLYQVAFFERSLQHNPVLHLNTLCEGLESAKSFLDLYLWLPPKSEMNLTNSEWIQLSFGLTLAAKFAIVSKDPNVELQTRELRQRLNIENIFRHLSLRIGALVGRAGDGNKQKDIFAYYEQRTRKIQNWYERMCRATGSDSSLGQPAQMAAQQTQTQTQPSPPVPSTSAASLHTPPQQTPMAATGYSPLQPMAYPNSVNTIGSSPYASGYSPAPAIAFPDLMNAPGWDMPFAIPMEDTAWMFDPAAGYQGLNMASPQTSEGTWGSLE